MAAILATVNERILALMKNLPRPATGASSRTATKHRRAVCNSTPVSLTLLHHRSRTHGSCVRERLYPHSRRELNSRKTSFRCWSRLEDLQPLLIIAEDVGAKYWRLCGEQTLWPVAGCCRKGVRLGCSAQEYVAGYIAVLTVAKSSRRSQHPAKERIALRPGQAKKITQDNTLVEVRANYDQLYLPCLRPLQCLRSPVESLRTTIRRGPLGTLPA